MKKPPNLDDILDPTVEPGFPWLAKGELAALDRMADKVLGYRPKDKAKKLRSKARKAKKGAKKHARSSKLSRADGED